MTERTRLISAEIDDQEVNQHNARYGSVQPEASSSQAIDTMDDNKTTLTFLEKIGFSLGKYKKFFNISLFYCVSGFLQRSCFQRSSCGNMVRSSL